MVSRISIVFFYGNSAFGRISRIGRRIETVTRGNGERVAHGRRCVRCYERALLEKM